MPRRRSVTYLPNIDDPEVVVPEELPELEHLQQEQNKMGRSETTLWGTCGHHDSKLEGYMDRVGELLPLFDRAKDVGGQEAQTLTKLQQVAPVEDSHIISSRRPLAVE